MRAFLFSFILLTSLPQLSIGQNNPFLDLIENEKTENYCELESWYKKFHAIRKKNKNSFDDQIKTLKTKIERLNSNNCMPNELLDTLKGKLYFYLGIAYRQTNFINQSLESYNKALSIFKLYSNFKPLAVTYRKLGTIWMLKKDFNKANDYFKISEKICVENKLDSSLHRTYQDMIINYLKWNRPNDTILIDKIYFKAKAIPNISDSERLEIETNMSLLYLKNGNYKRALNIYTNSESKYRHLKSYQNLAITLKNKADILIKLGQYYTIENIFDEIQDLIDSDKVNDRDKHFKADFLLTKAAYHIALQQYQQAQNYHQQILQFINPLFTYETIHQNPNPDQIFGNPYLLTTLADKAEVYKKMHTQTNNKTNLTHALECYELSYIAADQMRKEYSFEDANIYLSDYTYNYYEKAIELCQQLAKAYPNQQQKYQNKAFEIAQRSSMKTLFWTINSKVVTKFLSKEDSIEIVQLRDQLVKVKESITNKNNSEKQEKDLLEVRQNYGQAEKRMEAKYPEYAKLKFENQLVSVDTLQQNRLNDNEALLNYFVGDSSITCFVVTQTSFRIVEIKEVDIVMDNIKLWRESIQKKKTSDSLAAKLYQQLLSEALSNLSQNFNTLIINGDAALAGIPFEALKEQADRRDYLLHKYNISYTLHPHFIKKRPEKGFFDYLSGSSRNPFRERKTFKVFTADYSNSKLDTLYFAKQEIEKIQKIMGGSIYHLATKKLVIEQLKDPETEIIHFATHAVGDSLETTNSKIFLTPYANVSSQDDLYLDDILNLNCNADLVVLSACQTGLGVYNRGEGISSLARAFRTIGSKSLVMSLWKANDLTTASIMENFYQHLENGELKSEALRQAKIEFLNSDKFENHQRDPYYWAAFLLQGEPDALY